MKTTRKNIALGSLCIAVSASLLLPFQAGCPRSGAVPSPDAENRPMPWTSRRAITPGSTEAFISPGSTEVFVPTGRQMPPSRKGAKQRLPEQAMIQTLPTHPEVQAVDPDYVKLLQKKLEIATQQYDSVRAKFLSGGKGGEANKEAKARFDLACAEIALHRATGDQVKLREALRRKIEAARDYHRGFKAARAVGTATLDQLFEAELALAEAEYEMKLFEKGVKPTTILSPPVRAVPARPAVELKFQGRSFADWNQELQTELDPLRRAEAMRAMAAFGTNGLGKEAMEVIVKAMKPYNFSTISDTDVGKMKEAAVEAICSRETAIPLEDSMPILLRLLENSLENGNDNEFTLALKALSRLAEFVRFEQDAAELLYACLWNDQIDKCSAADKQRLFRVFCLGSGTNWVLKFLSEAIRKNDETRFDWMCSNVRHTTNTTQNGIVAVKSQDFRRLNSLFSLPFSIVDSIRFLNDAGEEINPPEVTFNKFGLDLIKLLREEGVPSNNALIRETSLKAIEVLNGGENK